MCVRVRLCAFLKTCLIEAIVCAVTVTHAVRQEDAGGVKCGISRDLPLYLVDGSIRLLTHFIQGRQDARELIIITQQQHSNVETFSLY